jgi:hypothetical protein
VKIAMAVKEGGAHVSHEMDNGGDIKKAVEDAVKHIQEVIQENKPSTIDSKYPCPSAHDYGHERKKSGF